MDIGDVPWRLATMALQAYFCLTLCLCGSALCSALRLWWLALYGEMGDGDGQMVAAEQSTRIHGINVTLRFLLAPSPK